MKSFSEMTIAMASDHAGFPLKQQVQLFLEDNGAKVKDFGCYSTESCDYPDFAHPLAEAVEKGEFEFGIVICSTGNGICMTANKHQGIRAALCWDTKLAELARAHNNANVLGLPANFISAVKALDIVRTFFQTDFEGERHERRVNKIPCKSRDSLLLELRTEPDGFGAYFSCAAVRERRTRRGVSVAVSGMPCRAAG